MSELLHKLSLEIEKNIIQTQEGPFLQAGSNQFQSFWTRDFCFAALGLLELDKFDVVQNHLQKLLDSLNGEGLIPRILESSNSKKTVILSTIFRALPYSLRKSKHEKKLKAEHYGEHGTLAIDSNALVIILSFQLAYKKENQDFINQNKDKLIQAFNFYNAHKKNDFISQDAFSDWQDSSARTGEMFYTNLLYYLAAHKLSLSGFIEFDHEGFKQKLKERFFRDGLYRSTTSGEHFGMEANYLAIIFDFHSKIEQLALLEKLEEEKYNPAGFPLCSYPHYPAKDISWTCKIVGLTHYHDEMIWSWIIGLKLLALKKCEQTALAKELMDKIQSLLERDGTIYEIYSPDDTGIINYPLYRSESPFSWGLGIMIWALRS